MERFLKKADLKPHQYKGWLNSHDKIKNPDEFTEKVKDVCEVYKKAQLLQTEGIKMLCVDEKTDIQATEDKNPSKPMKIGEVEKIEQEYVRKDATGEIIAPLIQPTRTETDFVDHLKGVIDLIVNTYW